MALQPSSAIPALPGIPPETSYNARIPSPDGTVQRESQYGMLRALKERGRPGLAKYIRDYADKRSKTDTSPSWRDIRDDYDTDQHKMLILLYSLPVDILKSLIKNRLMYDCEINPSINRSVMDHMRVFNVAGTYANLL